MTKIKSHLLTSLQQRLLYVVSALLWISGTLWLYLKYVMPANEESGFQFFSWTSICLKLHGAGAMVFLVIFGMLLYHIPLGWPQKDQRPSGISLLFTCVILILTGWGLYYVGHEMFRSLLSLSHSIIGIMMPFFIYFHIRKVLRKTKNNC